MFAQKLAELQSSGALDWDFKLTRIGDEGAKAIAEALKVNSTPQCLNISSNGIGDDGAKAIAEALIVNQTLQHLDISANNIGVDGVKAIAETLKVNSTLQLLDLSRNKIAADGAKAIAEALKVNSTLQQFNFGSNEIGADGVSSIAEVLKVNTTLQQFNIGMNKFGDDGAKAIAEALKVNRTLQQFYISGNEIGSDGGKAIAEVLKDNCTLQQLDISRNTIRADGAKGIAEVLKVNSCLQRLDIHSNSISADGGKAIADALKVNSTLQHLVIYKATPSPVDQNAQPNGASVAFQGTCFAQKYAATCAPEVPHQLLDAMHRMVTQYGAEKNIQPKLTQEFYHKLQTVAFGHPQELLSEVQSAAMRLWTSMFMLQGREFSAILNYLLWEDNAAAMPSVVVVVRAINELVLVRRAGPLKQPSNHTVYRGAWLPDQHREFYIPHKKYRVPAFFAASIEMKVAQRIFCQRAQMKGKPPVLFVITLDADWGCLHVNFVEKAECPGEEEYLFAPYSVFTVEGVAWEPSPNWQKPHIIRLSAAVDNLLEPDCLPLAPWA